MRMTMSEPVRMRQPSCVLRVNVSQDGTPRVVTDYGAMDLMGERDILLLLGCIRQLEHRVLTTYNENFADKGENED